MQKIYPKLVLPLNNQADLSLIPEELLDRIELSLITHNIVNPITLPNNIFPIFKEEIDFLQFNQPSKGLYIEQVTSEAQLKTQIVNIKKQYPEAIIGVEVNNSYDLAMIAADMGADFVSFNYRKGDDFEQFLYLIETWTSYTIIQSMLIADELTDEQLRLCLEKGIDFLCFIKTFWNQPKSIVEKIENLNNLLNQYPYTIINFDEE